MQFIGYKIVVAWIYSILLQKAHALKTGPQVKDSTLRSNHIIEALTSSKESFTVEFKIKDIIDAKRTVQVWPVWNK